jgi:hypothetical protein
MVFKKYYASPYTYLILKMKISDEWAEQLPLLARVADMKNVEELIKTPLAWRLLTEQQAIDKQRQENIEAQKRVDKYWKWHNGENP